MLNTNLNCYTDMHAASRNVKDIIFDTQSYLFHANITFIIITFVIKFCHMKDWYLHWCFFIPYEYKTD